MRCTTIDGADALVGGGAAFYLDTKTRLDPRQQGDHPDRAPGGVLLILIGLLRAVLAPLLLMGTVVLSFGAALGMSSLLFEYVFGFAGSDPGFPLFAFVFLVALGHRLQHLPDDPGAGGDAHARHPQGLADRALGSTGGVITSAGLVLAATFLVLGRSRWSSSPSSASRSALGVLLDTMIVRSVLVTALNLDLGGKIWWPSNLDRNGHNGRAAGRGAGAPRSASVQRSRTTFQLGGPGESPGPPARYRERDGQ